MTIGEILQATTLSRSETEILLAALCRKERAWIMAHPEHALTKHQETTWREWNKRRLRGEPSAYIRGEQEFYGRLFTVNADTLIPRPATEGLIGVALAWLNAPSDAVVPTDAGIVAISRVLHQERPSTIIDVGTGSGAIAVTLACERKDLTVIATDISPGALLVAKRNAERHGTADRIAFLQGSLLDPVCDFGNPFLLVSNPPYVSSRRTLPRDIAHFEPKEAIFAGEDGLSVIRPLIEQAKNHPGCCGIVMECEEGQVTAVDTFFSH